MRCACGKEIVDGASRCPECEALQEHAGMQKCPACRSLMKADAHYCLVCGKHIQRFAVISDEASASYSRFADSDLLRRASENVAAIATRSSIKPPAAPQPQAGDPVPPKPREAAQAIRSVPKGPSRAYKPLAVLIFTAISIAMIWWALSMIPSNTSSRPSVSPILNSISGTRWRGNIGRSPASLAISCAMPAGNCSGRMNYEGIAEDLTVRVNADGTLVLAGTGYHRESGVGAFALDTFYGQLSLDGRQLQGSLIDGSRKRGQWMVAKIETTESFAAATAKVLSPEPTAVTHWQGTIGNWPATLNIFPRKLSGEWSATGAYHGVVEDFSVTVKDDGSVVLAGYSYYREAGAGPFSLDTLYGQLSADGQHLQGLRIDANSRGPWNLAKIGGSTDSSTDARVLQDISCSRESYNGPIEDDKQSKIEFVNDMSEGRQIFWINSSNQRVFYRDLEAHQSYTQGTFATHLWVITDQSGTCKQAFVALEGTARAIIQK